MIQYVILSTLLFQGVFREPPHNKDPRLPKEQRCQDWTTRKELPLLRAKLLEPIKDRDHFDRTHGYLKYRRKDISADRTEGFGEDEEAIKVAEAFLTEHFGKLPDPVFPIRIAKGKDVSSDIDGPNLLVVFETRHHGIPLDGYGAVVYFRGRVITMASIMLASVAPVPDSERSVISKEQAIRVWNDQAPEQWKKAVQPKNLRLEYVWSPRDNMDSNVGRKRGDILRPNWDIHDGLLIDAFDGKIWRDD